MTRILVNTANGADLPIQSHSPLTLVRRIFTTQPILFRSGVAMLVLAVLGSAGLLLDERTVNGINLWIKPIKFLVSVGVYQISLAAFFLALSPLANRSVAGRYIVWTSLGAGWFEVLYIAIQAARGTTSHWNYSSTLTIFMYALMGVGAVVLTSAAFVQGWMIWRYRSVAIPPALRWGLVIGLMMTFVLGAGFGGAMSAISTTHWVGGTLSDANGLPLMEWSRDGGDLRVAHFFGIHAMHFVPAFAWLAVRTVSKSLAIHATVIFAVLLAMVTIGTFVQALLGQPFIAM